MQETAPALSRFDGPISRCHPYIRKEDETLDRIATDVLKRREDTLRDYGLYLGSKRTNKAGSDNLLLLGRNWQTKMDVPRAAWLEWVGRQWGFYAIYSPEFVQGTFEDRIRSIRDIVARVVIEQPTSRMSQ